jgi:hypothetical protein
MQLHTGIKNMIWKLYKVINKMKQTPEIQK